MRRTTRDLLARPSTTVVLQVPYCSRRVSSHVVMCYYCADQDLASHNNDVRFDMPPAIQAQTH